MIEAEMTCRELVELVTDYLEGTLPAAERARFEAHLADCPDCTNYLDQMRRTMRLLGTLGEETMTPEAKERLLWAFRDWQRGGSAGGEAP